MPIALPLILGGAKAGKAVFDFFSAKSQQKSLEKEQDVFLRNLEAQTKGMSAAEKRAFVDKAIGGVARVGGARAATAGARERQNLLRLDPTGKLAVGTTDAELAHLESLGVAATEATTGIELQDIQQQKAAREQFAEAKFAVGRQRAGTAGGGFKLSGDIFGAGVGAVGGFLQEQKTEGLLNLALGLQAVPEGEERTSFFRRLLEDPEALKRVQRGIFDFNTPSAKTAREVGKAKKTAPIRPLTQQERGVAGV